jgi:polyferredoxin
VLSLALVGIDVPFIHLATGLQFIPSLVKFTITFTATGFIIVIILAVLVGRVYCSAICPLGILQDIISRLGRKFRKQKIYRYSRPQNYLRYGFLGVILLSFVVWGTIILVFFDPHIL